MKTFNNKKEIEKYYNENTNTYEFVENGMRLDIELNFNLDVTANIKAGHIDAGNINVWNIIARDINVWNIKAWDINAGDIKAWDIIAWDIIAWDINARDIKAWNIIARDINVWNIIARDINADNINAKNISYLAVCFAYKNIECKSIGGRRLNSKHFCLDSEIKIKKEKKVTIELTQEQLDEIKASGILK